MNNNKLIAEFMGIKPTKGFGYKWHYSDSPFITINDNNYEKVEKAIAEYVKYHSSWDWLMPVVAKIESLGYWINRIDGDYTIYNNKKEIIYITPNSSGGIDMLYKIVVEFIKWYNNK